MPKLLPCSIHLNYADCTIMIAAGAACHKDLDVAPAAGYVLDMAQDPEVIAERRRRMAENGKLMDRRWHRLLVDLAVLELAKMPATAIH